MTDFVRLTRPFPSEQIKERQGKRVSGIPMVFRYVPSQFVVERLNEIGPDNWNFIIKDSKEYNGEVVVLGSLKIGNTVKDAYGSATLTEGKTLGDSYKSASMLSLVKATSLFNVPCIFHANLQNNNNNQQHKHNQATAAPSQKEHSFAYSCMDCGVIISDAEVSFSKKYADTYQNKELCRECQRDYRQNIRRVK